MASGLTFNARLAVWVERLAFHLELSKMKHLVTDLRYAFRILRTSPALVLGLGLCLGLGVGANAAIVGVLDVVLFRQPAHVDAPSEVVRVQLSQKIPGVGEIDLPTASYPIYRDLAGGVDAFAAVAAYFGSHVSIGSDIEARPARATMVSSGFFPLLGTKPAVGRFFDVEESSVSSGAQVVVLGWELWKERFFGDEAAIGRGLRIGQETFTVVGVAPRGFEGVEIATTDLWLPLGVNGRFMGPDWYQSRGSMFLNIVARLADGTSAGPASAEASALLQHQNSAEAGGAGPSVTLAPLLRGRGPHPGTGVRIAGWLAAMSLVLLLVACANAANLLLTRTIRQQRELALRSALGARPRELFRHVMLQGLVLGAVAATTSGGTLVGTHRLVRSFLLPEAQPAGVLGLDLRLFALAVSMSLMLGIVSAVVPALCAYRTDLSSLIQVGSGIGHPRSALFRSTSVVAQIALTLVLLSVAGVALRNLEDLLDLDPGFEADGLLLVTSDLGKYGYGASEVDQLFERMRDRVEEIPGVTGAVLAAGGPFGHGYGVQLSVSGVEEIPQLYSGTPSLNAVSEGFFRMMGARIVDGRSLGGPPSSGGTPTAAVINQTMATLLWPDGRAVGNCIEISDPGSGACTPIVGVVRDLVHQSLREEPSMQVYIRLAESPTRLDSRSMFVRLARDSDSEPSLVNQAVRGVEPGLPWVDIRPLSRELEPDLRPWRFSASIFGLLGGLALLVSVVGLYAVIAFNVAQRWHELGVRVALGADRRRIATLVAGGGLRLGALGVILGGAGAWALSRATGTVVFKVGEADPVVLGLAALLILVTTGVASYLPARWAARVDPARNLKSE